MIFSVFGQRDVALERYNDYAHVSSCMSSIGDIESLLLGGGNGLDKLVQQWAEEHKVPYRIIKPNLDKFPGDIARAFSVRNDRMITQSEACIIFSTEDTRLTLHLISKIIVAKKSTIVFPM